MRGRDDGAHRRAARRRCTGSLTCDDAHACDSWLARTSRQVESTGERTAGQAAGTAGIRPRAQRARGSRPAQTPSVESVRLCPAVSGASSMRGGRSTRASHQSRLRRLPPHTADARRIGMPPRSARSMACAPGTRRQSRQPEPTQVSGLIPAQLRAWSCEIAAKRVYVRLDMDPTSDDQQRSSRIRPVVRRRSRITRKRWSFGPARCLSKSGVTATNGGLCRWSRATAMCRSRTRGSGPHCVLRLEAHRSGSVPELPWSSGVGGSERKGVRGRSRKAPGSARPSEKLGILTSCSTKRSSRRGGG